MSRLFPVLPVLLAASLAGADGLMLPVEHDYPHELLRNRVTQARVEMQGVVAVTSVYREFVNEWHRETAAVYSFPLPPEARATEILYWRGEEPLQAVLRVRDQAVNPGTGEGGTAARLNRYLGRNGIRIRIDGIEPHAIQRVQLTYISLCGYISGECRYRYPLDTGEFVTWPLEHLQFSFIVRSNSDIVDFGLPTHPDYRTVSSAPKEVEVTFSRPKSYLNRDLEFYYTVDQAALGVDFHSAANDTSDGHFALFVRPQSRPDEGSVLPRRVLFLLSNSGRMFGATLDQSIRAISRSLEQLRPEDRFNILLFNNQVTSWKPAPVPADGLNVAAAVDFLMTVETAAGSRLDRGLKRCLSQISNDDFSNAVLVFTDGRSPLDPREIESLNEHRAAIFPIGIGPDLDRARLEMTAALNYGFVTYIDENTRLEETMAGVLERISNPVLKNTVMEHGRADLYEILPQKIPDTYSGSFFFVTGRYKTPGPSSFSLAGYSTEGLVTFDFTLDFSGKRGFPFVEQLWAKEFIDTLEREIAVYGETPELRNRVIELSLAYNIRSRYTAYVAVAEEFAGDEPPGADGDPGEGGDDGDDGDDHTMTAVSVFEERERSLPTSAILGNYPNPFNSWTRILCFIHEGDAHAAKVLRIYNLSGQLVAVIDVSHLSPGMHEVSLESGELHGAPLASGLYIVQFKVRNTTRGALRINLVR